MLEGWTDEFSAERIIGRGGFGDVFRGAVDGLGGWYLVLYYCIALV